MLTFFLIMLMSHPGVTPPIAQSVPEAERTHCQAIARVIYGDLRGQKAMIDSLKGQPTKTAADEARITSLESTYTADSQLFEALRARYATAAMPTPEAMKELRNTSFNEIKRQAQLCLAG